MSTKPTRAGMVALAAALVAIAGACNDAPASAPKVPEVFDLDHDPAASVAEVDPNRGVVAPADELRLILERNMAWHGITLVEAMRDAERGETDVTRWTKALVANTDDVTAAVGLVYGPVGARAFHQLWAQHTQFLVDYAAAAGRGDREAMAQARRHLRDYAKDSGSLLDTATGGRLTAETGRAVLQTHVDHMMEQIDAVAADDMAKSQRIALEDHSYLYTIASGLAGAISQQQPVAFPGSTTSPFADHVSEHTLSVGQDLLIRLGTGAKGKDAPSVDESHQMLTDAEDDARAGGNHLMHGS